MTKEEFRARVTDVCELIKLKYDANYRHLIEEVKHQNAEQPHFKAADHRVLIGLLQAAIEFPQVLQETSLVEPGVYSKRRDYATHQDKPSKYTLLREVRIEFVTDAMSLDIEMIDLPGLGVDKESDDKLTLNFLPHLDGAFMFQLASQVKSAEISRLAEPMRAQHRSTLGGRVWMVITRCDDLNELQLHGPPEDVTQPSMFCHLDETLGNQGLTGDAVIFIGNAYHVALAGSRGPDDPQVPPEVLSRFPLVLKFDAAGEPVVPERCERRPGQVEPWRRFVRDGGLSFLRETMQTKVAESVRAQTRRTVADGLAKAIQRLVDELEVAEQQSGMSVEQMKRAATWSGKLATLAADVGQQPQYVQPVVEGVAVGMNTLLTEWGMPPASQLAANHANLARLLARTGIEEAGKATQRIADMVKQALESQIEAAPCPESPGLPTPLEHWGVSTSDYLEPGKTVGTNGHSGPSSEFRSAIFGGIDADPSPFANDGTTTLSIEDYVEIMKHKIGRTTHVFGSRLVHEIQEHLEWLARRYRAVAAEGDRVDDNARASYAQFRSRLIALR
jgi:rubrerythrin